MPIAGHKRMYDTPTELALATPPATVAVLTVFGVSVSDAVSAVMLFWGLTLVAQKLWQFWRWLRRRGWMDP